MNEAETRAELIDPALKAAGWGVVDASRVAVRSSPSEGCKEPANAPPRTLPIMC